MSKTGWKKTTVKPSILATLLGFLIACQLAAIAPTRAFADATVVPLNASLRSHGDAGGEPELYKLEVPAAGLVTVEVAVPGLSEVEAKLGFLGRGENPAVDGESTVVERRATGLALVTEAPGTYLFRVAAQDPRRSLGRYKITTGFVAAEIFGGRSKEDDGVIEIDPDLAPPPPDPEDKEDDGVIEIDPDSRAPHPGNRALDEAALRLAWRELCRRKADDHSETPGCATRLQPGRRVVAGELGGAWGDDDDFFMFRLTELRTVQIATAGDVDTFGGLYDADGQRLAIDDDGGEGSNFRLAKTLSPGLYFVRVEGNHSAAGPYTLYVETSSW